MADNDILLLSIARYTFLTTNEKLLLYRSTASVRQLAETRREGVERLIGRRLRCRDFDPVGTIERAEGDRKRLTRKKIEYTFYQNAGYPPQLREIHNPPFLLFYRGELPEYELPMLGIVGTRHPTGNGASAAFELGYDAGRNGIGVVSGLALGIDGFAHAGNVAGGGRTVAVLGCGVDVGYPTQNQDLSARILGSGGILMSEYPPGEPPLRYHFPERNRILSGLCRGVAVIEAPARSGALITVDHALDQGRDLFVHRQGLAGSAGEGTRRLADDGARVIDGIADILEEWGSGACAPEHASATTYSGRNLASLMRAELAGELVLHRGRYFRRVGNG